MAVEEVLIPGARASLAWESVARGLHLGAAPNPESPHSTDVLTGGIDAVEMLSTPSG